MRIATWNVNGLRSVVRGDFGSWLDARDCDVVCVQEAKVEEDLLTDRWFPGYDAFWNVAERTGYSGVATLVADGIAPSAVSRGIGHAELDLEGRVLTTEFEGFTLLNVYAPHSHRRLLRVEAKLAFLEGLLAEVRRLRRRGSPLVLVGDFNVAHAEIDLANARSNRGNAGFLPEEREWVDRLLSEGFVDAFRHLNGEPGHYTWWSMRSGVRERNVGWRLDYAFVDERCAPSIRSCFHDVEQGGSDHCPVILDLDLS